MPEEDRVEHDERANEVPDVIRRVLHVKNADVDVAIDTRTVVTLYDELKLRNYVHIERLVVRERKYMMSCRLAFWRMISLTN